MIRLEREINSRKTVIDLNKGEWYYFTWSPDGGPARFEYVIAPTTKGAIIANRPNKLHPFYPFVIRGTREGQGLGAKGPTESFKVTVFNNSK